MPSSPREYFTQTIPAQYAAALAGSPAVAAQAPLSAVFEVIGGGVFSLRSEGGQLEVQDGEQIDAPDMRVTMSYDDWHSFAEGGSTESFVDYIQRGKVVVVKGLKGTVAIELTRSDDSLWHSTTVFGGQAEPALKVMMASDDYKAMMSGELNSQMAFLTGKLKFEGSLPMLMQLGALAS